MLFPGYKLIDLHDKPLSTTATVIEGVYKALHENKRKMIVLNGIRIGDVFYDNASVHFTHTGTEPSLTYSTVVYGYTLAITSDDEVTATEVSADEDTMWY